MPSVTPSVTTIGDYCSTEPHCTTDSDVNYHWWCLWGSESRNLKWEGGWRYRRTKRQERKRSCLSVTNVIHIPHPPPSSFPFQLLCSSSLDMAKKLLEAVRSAMFEMAILGVLAHGIVWMIVFSLLSFESKLSIVYRAAFHFLSNLSVSVLRTQEASFFQTLGCWMDRLFARLCIEEYCMYCQQSFCRTLLTQSSSP